MNLTEAVTEIEKTAADRSQPEEGDYWKDGLLYCHKCNTPKQKEIRGHFYPCMCKCAVENKKQREAEKQRQEFMDRIKRLRKMGFQDSEMSKWTFDNDDKSNAELSKIARNYVDHFQEFRKMGKGLLLFGAVGSGKTYMAACIANALIDKAYACLVTNFPRLVNTLQGMYQGKQEYIDGLNQFDLLVVDDLAAERDTEYMNEIIENIIDARYRAVLPLIVTTNLTRMQIYNPDDIRKQRTYSRLLEMCYPYQVKNSDRRKDIALADRSDVETLLGLR